MSNFLAAIIFSAVFFILGDIVGIDKIIEGFNQIISKSKCYKIFETPQIPRVNENSFKISKSSKSKISLPYFPQPYGCELAFGMSTLFDASLEHVDEFLPHVSSTRWTG